MTTVLATRAGSGIALILQRWSLRISKMAKGAIAALIIFVVGIALNLPNEINIGIIILNSFKPIICGSQTGVVVACSALNAGIVAIRILGIGLIVGNLFYIIKQVRKGNCI